MNTEFTASTDQYKIECQAQNFFPDEMIYFLSFGCDWKSITLYDANDTERRAARNIHNGFIKRLRSSATRAKTKSNRKKTSSFSPQYSLSSDVSSKRPSRNLCSAVCVYVWMNVFTYGMIIWLFVSVLKLNARFRRLFSSLLLVCTSVMVNSRANVHDSFDSRSTASVCVCAFVSVSKTRSMFGFCVVSCCWENNELNSVVAIDEHWLRIPQCHGLSIVFAQLLGDRWRCSHEEVMEEWKVHRRLFEMVHHFRLLSVDQIYEEY